MIYIFRALLKRYTLAESPPPLPVGRGLCAFSIASIVHALPVDIPYVGPPMLVFFTNMHTERCTITDLFPRRVSASGLSALLLMYFPILFP